MQLTNILRDVDEDAVNGRLYLPLAELAMFGCDPMAVLARRPDGEFVQLIQFQIARARGLYASSLRGLPALTPSGRFDHARRGALLRWNSQGDRSGGLRCLQGPGTTASVSKLRQTPRLAAEFIRLSLAPARFA